MSAADIRQHVREEVERLLGGGEHVRFPAGHNHQPGRPGAFFDRFVEVMNAIHMTLRELTDRVGRLENRMANLEQTIEWRRRAPGGDGAAVRSRLDPNQSG